ncbi:hypothetical protein HDU67_008179 [Dinochytrium kinnereticum]|nr:hypothetical protein HDU67_008179 [Dinochytrium kinnereticum]
MSTRDYSRDRPSAANSSSASSASASGASASATGDRDYYGSRKERDYYASRQPAPSDYDHPPSRSATTVGRGHRSDRSAGVQPPGGGGGGEGPVRIGRNADGFFEAPPSARGGSSGLPYDDLLQTLSPRNSPSSSSGGGGLGRNTTTRTRPPPSGSAMDDYGSSSAYDDLPQSSSSSRNSPASSAGGGGLGRNTTTRTRPPPNGSADDYGSNSAYDDLPQSSSSSRNSPASSSGGGGISRNATTRTRPPPSSAMDDYSSNSRPYHTQGRPSHSSNHAAGDQSASSPSSNPASAMASPPMSSKARRAVRDENGFFVAPGGTSSSSSSSPAPSGSPMPSNPSSPIPTRSGTVAYRDRERDRYPRGGGGTGHERSGSFDSGSRGAGGGKYGDRDEGTGSRGADPRTVATSPRSGSSSALAPPSSSPPPSISRSASNHQGYHRSERRDRERDRAPASPPSSAPAYGGDLYYNKSNLDSLRSDGNPPRGSSSGRGAAPPSTSRYRDRDPDGPRSAAPGAASMFDDMMRDLDSAASGSSSSISSNATAVASSVTSSSSSALKSTSAGRPYMNGSATPASQTSTASATSPSSPPTSSSTRDYDREKSRERRLAERRERERERERAGARRDDRGRRDEPPPPVEVPDSPTTKERRRKEAEEREMEMERNKIAEAAEAARREKERRETEKRELEREDAERRLHEIERLRRVGGDVGSPSIDEGIIVPDYVRALIRVLLSDKTLTPTPDDFSTPDGFTIWQKTIGGPLQQVISDLLQERHIDAPLRKKSEPPPSSTEKKKTDTKVTIFFKVVEARGLIAKEGKTRDAFCKIEHGPLPVDGGIFLTTSKKNINPDVEAFQTDVQPGTTNPVWNQHLKIDVRNIMDRIAVSVWDQRKEEFLGVVRLSMGEVMTTCARDGYLSKWYGLGPREAKSKDKYVGGELFLEIHIQDDKIIGPNSTAQPQSTQSPTEFLDTALQNCKINYKSLYKTLLRNCLTLDMRALERITDNTVDLLSDESKTTLKVWARRWLVGEAFQFIALVELLFNEYKQYNVPVLALFTAYEAIHDRIPGNGGWLSVYDKPALIDLLEQMFSYYQTQVTKYKEFYAKNKPDGALVSTILMWRMVFKSNIYKEVHPELPISFKEHLTGIMSEAATARYQKLLELSSPFDESNIEAVFDGLTKLTELLTEEIEIDYKYFKRPFKKDIDIVGLTADVYIRNFVKSLEEHEGMLASDEAINTASKAIFALYRKMKVMDSRYAKLKPELRRISNYKSFNVEKWFSPFVVKWLDNLSTRTLEWVTNALKADTFEPIGGPDPDGNPPCSTSITDLFSAVYQELEFIADLGWSNAVQNAGFFQKFARTVNTAIEQYCDAIGMGELKIETGNAGTTWTALLQTKQANGPKDITNESCVKLCNIEYALNKLDDMYRLMNVATLTRTVKDYRATIAPMKKKSPKGSPTTIQGDEDEEVKGSFKVQIAYAENVKPVTSAGLSNPFVTIRVPDGTVVPPPDPDDPTTGAVGGATTAAQSGAPVVLNGSACEMARTRVIYETLNPTWDETFTMMLPPVTRLEVTIFSKNMLTSDELCGRATIDLGSKTRLRRKLADHHTHDVFVEAEPQGRILLRMTMEGEEEDVDFWFRRTKERLVRTRDDFLRSLCAKLTPYVKEIMIKSLKEHEAAPLPSKSFFSAITSTVQYSNQTANGIAIDQPVNQHEADYLLAPLTDYLNKNLEIICMSMSSRMAKEVIKRTWDEAIIVAEFTLVPPLYGLIERDRRVLNRRQISMSEWSLHILRDFFHADGAEAGLSKRSLETRKYVDVTSLIGYYGVDLKKLKREYEISLIDGREKELMLRLIRLRIEKQEDLSVGDRDEGRKWIDSQLSKRREKR